jgi:hypothetical protein
VVKGEHCLYEERPCTYTSTSNPTLKQKQQCETIF